MKAIIKQTNAIVLSLCAAFLINCNSCSTSHKAESRHLQVSPEQSNSGEIIYLYDSTRSIKADSNTIIKFGQSTGAFIKADTSGQIAVMVPNLNQGEYKISVLKNKDTIGFSTIKIAAPPSMLLVLSINSNHEIKVVKSIPYNGIYQSGFSQSGSQLSFDLTDGSNVFYSASIPDPVTAGMEVFKGRDSISHEKIDAMGSATFAIKVPNLQHASMINFYISAPNQNLLNADGRRSRKLVSQISLGNIQK